MGKIGIITLLVLCLILLLLNGCMINTVTPEIDNGNFGSQEDINQSNNSSQNSSTGSVEEPVIADTEEPVEEPGTVYPQKWTTGDGTAASPWADDCINKAITNCPAGGTIFLKAGYYSSPLININKSLNLIGEGRGKTIIVTSMTKTNGIYIETDYCTLEGFTIDGTSQTDGADLHCIAIGYPTNYLTLENIEVKNAGLIGINYGDINHSTFKNIYAHDNYHDGMHSSTTLTGRGKYNTYRDIYCWNNGTHGFDDGGVGLVVEDCSNLYDNIQCWDNGTDGIVFWLISGGIVSNCSAWGNAKDGIVLGLVEDFDVHNCTANLNDYFGIRTNKTENINFTNVTAKNNNVLDNPWKSGIIIEDGIEIKLNFCQFYDDRYLPLQEWGIYTEDTCSIEIISCVLLPNRTGTIYAGVGTIITNKMLAKF